jgi:outer membrane protein OmpA-like peptidoglycan-associated protein
VKAELRVSESSRQRAEEEAERAHDEAADLRVQVRALQAQVDQLSEQARQAEDRLGMVEREREAERQATQRTTSYQSLQQMLGPVACVQPDARGFKVVLPDSLFDPKTGGLKPTAAAKLNPIAGVLMGQPGVEFVIEGYMDDRGPGDVLQLSQLRAQSVGDFLSGAGVSADRFKVTGYGSANPVSPNKTLKGRVANRRVELVFLKP